MKKLKRQAHLCIVSIGLYLIFSQPIKAATIDLRILETTDIHMNLTNYDYYHDEVTSKFGLENTLKLIKSARNQHPNNILIDNGDLLQGAPMGDVAFSRLQKGQIHPAYLIMNTFHYTAGNIGNHDFNYGLDFLKNAIAGANFPYINANVVDAKTGKNVFTPYIIVKKELVADNGKVYPINIGIIGFTPPQILQWDKQNLAGKVEVTDVILTAKKYIPQMKLAGADIIIAVPHSGLSSEYSTKPKQENIVLDLSHVKGIDAILFGHAHEFFPSTHFKDYPGVNLNSGTINGIPAVMAGSWGNSLGVIDLKLEHISKHWKIISSKASVLTLDKSNYLNQHISDLAESSHGKLQAWHLRTIEFMHEPIATVESPIYSYFSLLEPSYPVELIHRGQLWYAKSLKLGSKYKSLPILSVAAPFKAGGRQGYEYYTDIPVGSLFRKNIADIYVYPNTLCIVKVTGAEIKEWLELSAVQYNDLSVISANQSIINEMYPSFNFDTIAGDDFSYSIDLSHSPRYNSKGILLNKNSERINNLSYQNKPLEINQEFLLVTNNYRANGGGNFSGINSTKIIYESDVKNRDVLTEYLKLNPERVDSPLQKWYLTLPKNYIASFYTGKAAIKYLQFHPEFKLINTRNESIELQILN